MFINRCLLSVCACSYEYLCVCMPCEFFAEPRWSYRSWSGIVSAMATSTLISTLGSPQCNGHTDIHTLQRPHCNGYPCSAMQWPPPHWSTLWSPQCNGHLCSVPGTSAMQWPPPHWFTLWRPQCDGHIQSSTMLQTAAQCNDVVQCSMGRFAAAPPPVKMPLPHQCCATAKRFIPLPCSIF